MMTGPLSHNIVVNTVNVLHPMLHTSSASCDHFKLRAYSKKILNSNKREESFEDFKYIHI